MTLFLGGILVGVVLTFYGEGVWLIYQEERALHASPRESLREALLWPWLALWR